MSTLVDTPIASDNLIQVDLADRSYEIRVGESMLSRAGSCLMPLLAQPRVVVITDDNVAPLYLAELRNSLESEKIDCSHIILAAGEQTKSFDCLSDLIDRLLDQTVERGTTLVALGGGVIGDITGFASGIVLRGLDFIQIPTTLLAQVDSSVGGKTGINTRRGKNLVGLFHQPRVVLADVRTLDTLHPRQLRAGYAEVVKYGLINDPDFFSWLEDNGARVCNGEHLAQKHAVITSCKAKAAIVASDEREAGQRALLNLGHTFGHALEAETGFGDVLLHGEAVALGMTMAFDFSVRLGLCPPADAERLRRHLAAVGLPTALSDVAGIEWTADSLLDHMRRDKKVRDGRMTFVLARGIGQSFISRDVDVPQVHQLLSDAISQ